ncbi:DUF2892 domain-containing protein [Amorphus sp. 3PC139-8]|uniref:YgaP family membrane protein n=1 Tax=Amorphus sp. 3PC139-8 TaxID=2735676 RepID=UPI00345C9DBD
MTTNMGRLDRGLRLVAAAVLILIAFATDFAAAGALHWVLLAVAAIFVVTALVGVCPLYRVFGIRTCPSR